MKKQLLSSFFIAMLLMIGVCSCDDIAEEIPTQAEQMALDCGINPKEYKNFGARYGNDEHTIVVFFGIKNDCIAMVYANTETKKQLGGYVSKQPIPKKKTFKLEGAKVKTAYFDFLYIYSFVCTDKSFATQVSCSYINEINENSYSYPNFYVKTTLFSYEGETTTVTKTYRAGEFQYLDITPWYNYSVFMGNECYTATGEYLFTCPNERPSKATIKLTQEAGLNLYENEIRFSRFNYKRGVEVWSLKPVIDPTRHYTQVKYKVIDRAGDVLTFKLEAKIYNQVVDHLQYKVNVDTGKFVE